MTNLMLFFLCMYAIVRMPTADRQKFTKQMSKAFKGEKSAAAKVPDAQDSAVEQKKVEDNVAASLKRLLNTNDSDVVVSEKLIRMRLSRPVWFHSASAELQPEAAADLRPIGDILKGLPNSIIVEGHTDNVPIGAAAYKSNWELSAARADAVRRFLIEQVGLPEARFVMAAYGETKPAADNATAEGRRHNRRIEITVVRR